MPLSWNEIKTRATVFANEWKDEVNEHAEAKSFWDDFFNVFGISRRRVANNEKRALTFSKEWAIDHNEEAEAKEYLIQFLYIFDITRRRVATFEHRVKKLDKGDGYIDLLWKGRHISYKR